MAYSCSDSTSSREPHLSDAKKGMPSPEEDNLARGASPLVACTGRGTNNKYLEKLEEERQEARQRATAFRETLRAGQLSYSADSSAIDQRTYNRLQDQHWENQGVLAGLLNAMDIVLQVTQGMRTERPSTTEEFSKESNIYHRPEHTSMEASSLCHVLPWSSSSSS